jgi:hypothetical protein
MLASFFGPRYPRFEVPSAQAKPRRRFLIFMNDVNLVQKLATSAIRRVRAGGSVLSLVIASGLLLSTGCSSSSSKKSENPRFASVEILKNTPGQIDEMVVQVFRAHGYETDRKKWPHSVFEKKASRFSVLEYGTWGDDTPLTDRVRVSILPVGDETFMLQCQAFMVKDRGMALEEEVKLGHRASKPYQELLDEVAHRLNPGGPSSTP